MQLSRIYSDWWISKWTTFAFETLNGDRYNYIYVYAGLIGLFAALVQLRGSLFYGWSLTASTVIHNRMLLLCMHTSAVICVILPT